MTCLRNEISANFCLSDNFYMQSLCTQVFGNHLILHEIQGLGTNNNLPPEIANRKQLISASLKYG